MSGTVMPQLIVFNSIEAMTFYQIAFGHEWSLVMRQSE